MIQINYVRYRTFTLSLRSFRCAGTLFIPLEGCVRKPHPGKAANESRGNELRARTLDLFLSERDGSLYLARDGRAEGLICFATSSAKSFKSMLRLTGSVSVIELVNVMDDVLALDESFRRIIHDRALLRRKKKRSDRATVGRTMR